MKMRNIFFILIFFLKLCTPLFSETSGQKEEFVSDKNEVPVEADYENEIFNLKLKLENASAAERSRYLDAKREKFKSISKTNKTNRKSGS